MRGERAGMPGVGDWPVTPGAVPWRISDADMNPAASEGSASNERSTTRTRSETAQKSIAAVMAQAAYMVRRIFIMAAMCEAGAVALTAPAGMPGPGPGP